MSSLSTGSLEGAPVYGGKSGEQRLGKVHCCVFHPSEKRCLGFLVKRPDVLLMFHRPDSFVPLGTFRWESHQVNLDVEKGTSGESFCKKLGVNWDDCVIWSGMIVRTEDGEFLGRVSSVSFDAETGEVIALAVSEGTAANVLLGKRLLPASLIRGFKRGSTHQLALYEKALAQREEEGEADLLSHRQKALEAEAQEYGVLLVNDQAKEVEVSGGLAEKAGAATAVVGDKVSRAASTAAEAARPTLDKAGEAASKGAAAAGKAVNKGAYVAGRQLGRAKGMFAAFKEEYNKARK